MCILIHNTKIRIGAIQAGGPGSGRHPSGISKEEKLTKRRAETNQRRAVAREARKPFLSDKAKLAMKFMNVATKGTQDKAEHAEQMINKFLKGSIKSKDNAPFDIVHTVNGKRHGIEVKAIISQKNDKITQKGEAINRKMAYAKANKIKGVHTVAVDYRGKTPVVYHREGVGSFRLGNMTKVKGGFNGLSKLIG